MYLLINQVLLFFKIMPETELQKFLDLVIVKYHWNAFCKKWKICLLFYYKQISWIPSTNSYLNHLNQWNFFKKFLRIKNEGIVFFPKEYFTLVIVFFVI